jgi:hypothetical protein
MKNVFKPAALIALMCGVAVAQSSTPSATDTGSSQSQAQPTAPQSNGTPASGSQAQSGHPMRVAPGSVIPVQLTKTVDAKKAKNGDQVVAKVTMDMKTQSGEVLVPKDTKVIGHVTEAQPRNKEQKESQLGIAFDHAVTKDGKDMQMPMSIQAVIGQQEQQNQQSDANTPAGKQEAPGVPSGAAPVNGTAAKTSGTNGGPPPPSASSSAGGDNGEAASNGGRPPINAQTQGVIGISNLTLSPAGSGAQGSVMTSEKNNVKLESGTMLLLKVNQ